ncbi:MAG: pyridoxal phosphate-dependent class II aminotransferase [Calothrix sp. MO_192.B10]|nr:pyridoxal phosphate-dependent class II aminotransferase [Calothrix sp. MO_192.B10]
MQPAHGGNLAWAANHAGCSLGAIVDFSASISPLGPPPSVLAAMESQMGNVRHYPDPNYSELRLALSHFHQLPPEWILPGNGSAELLTLAGRELAELAATVLMTPAFGDYYRALRAYNANVQEFSLADERESEGMKEGRREFGVRSSEFGVRRERGKEGRSEGMIISSFSVPHTPPLPHSPTPSLPHLPISPLPHSPTPHTTGLLINNPHNPTGKLFLQSEILPYLEEFALVVVDEAFMDFLPPEEEQSLIGFVQKYPNLVILRSLTKFYSLPGLRLGYAIAHPERLQRWQLWRDPWSVNTLAATAAIAAIGDRDFQQQTWAWLPPARDELFQGLAKIPGLQPLESAANFLLIKSQVSCTKLQSQLLRKYQIFIRDCLSFPELGDRFFRVAVRTPADNQLLITALTNIMSNS